MNSKGLSELNALLALRFLAVNMMTAKALCFGCFCLSCICPRLQWLLFKFSKKCEFAR
jgi:hypothetical protein